MLSLDGSLASSSDLAKDILKCGSEAVQEQEVFSVQLGGMCMSFDF